MTAAETKDASPAVDEWIDWAGGDCPIEPGQIYDRRYRDGEEQLDRRASDRRSYNDMLFGHSGGDHDIIAYRIVS